MKAEGKPRFIADNNVGKLARWLRLLGYDTELFSGNDDGDMIDTALAEDRIVLTRDTQIMKRRLVTRGCVATILLKDDNTEEQLERLIETLKLREHRSRPFSICLECNQPLVKRNKRDVKDLVPVYVYQTQAEFTECPVCHRIYWRGTHWQAMKEKLKTLHTS